MKKFIDTDHLIKKAEELSRLKVFLNMEYIESEYTDIFNYLFENPKEFEHLIQNGQDLLKVMAAFQQPVSDKLGIYVLTNPEQGMRILKNSANYLQTVAQLSRPNVARFMDPILNDLRQFRLFVGHDDELHVARRCFPEQLFPEYARVLQQPTVAMAERMIIRNEFVKYFLELQRLLLPNELCIEVAAFAANIPIAVARTIDPAPVPQQRPANDLQ